MNQSLKMAGVATLGAGVGLVVGYKVAEKRLADRFEERLASETAGMKEFYTNVKQKYNSPEEAAAALIPQTEPAVEDPRVKTQRVQYNKIVKTEKYDGADPSEEELVEGCEIDEVLHKNVFDSVPTPEPDVAYIITQEQFMENVTDYQQATLTFYAKGGVLTDQRDEVIDNVEAVIGKISEANFGEGSSDPNIVHVRNPKLQLEFEILKSDRSFEEDVLGQDHMETPAERIRRQG